MTFVLFANVIATYVGVAQIYHTYRLETAGPTGFEMATSYYLNPNIVAWRHLAVKCMLNSLPLFLVSTGIRIDVNFDRQAVDHPRPSEWSALPRRYLHDGVCRHGFGRHLHTYQAHGGFQGKV